jgi:hypothetical protein
MYRWKLEIQAAVFNSNKDKAGGEQKKKISVEERKLKVTKLAQQQALSWDEGDLSTLRNGGLKIVIIKGLFTPAEIKSECLVLLCQFIPL